MWLVPMLLFYCVEFTMSRRTAIQKKETKKRESKQRSRPVTPNSYINIQDMSRTFTYINILVDYLENAKVLISTHCDAISQ